MTHDQVLVLGIGVATVALFLWDRWRHDMVALAALLACVLAGLVPAEEAFAGFGHPAVVTVACVLVLSHGLQQSGAVDALARRVVPARAGPLLTIAALATLGAFLSAFMNNVGAMALLMPVAMLVAQRHGLPAGKVLMPLAFCTILGGMTTLIGTPPNLIVSGFRAEAGLGQFGMFDFTPVGFAVAASGVLFMLFVGGRLVPTRSPTAGPSFDTGAYLTEARVSEGSKVVGARIRELDEWLDDAGAQVVGLIRNELRVMAPTSGEVIRRGDILVIEAEPEALAATLTTLQLKLEEDVPTAPEEDEDDEEAAAAEDAAAARTPPAEPAQHDTGDPEGDDGSGPGEEQVQEAEPESTRERQASEVVLRELVVMPGSPLSGRSATDIDLRTRYRVNLLAFSRQGRRSFRRLRSTLLRSGDVLLMQGAEESLSAFASEYRCVPLAARELRIPDSRKVLLATLLMGAAIASTALGLLSASVAFAAGVLAYMVFRIVPPREVYTAVDWPVVVLLGALIPVAGAMSTTGAADLLAAGMLSFVSAEQPALAVTLILIVTMTLSDFMNNAATAAVMCPVALSTAAQLEVNADSFLMAVAIGGSCAFLTPIGHQNNTLILGPGGFRFGDYWRVGLPVELVVVAVGVPMLLWIWPL